MFFVSESGVSEWATIRNYIDSIGATMHYIYYYQRVSLLDKMTVS